MSIDERLDPVELLNRYSAPNDWNRTIELTGPHADVRAVSLLERIIGGTIAATGPRRRHLRLVTGVVIAASLGGAAVAAATILSLSPDESRTVSCWSEPAMPPDAQVGLGWDGLGSPIDMCAGEWQDGGLGSEGPPLPLQACVTSEGVAAIMPGDAATCSQLGLSSFAPIDPGAPEGQRLLGVADLNQRLASTYNLGPCLDPDAVAAEVHLLLDDLGFDGWDVIIAGTFTADEPCASAAVDPIADTVFIVPLGLSD